jgi:hypothetical protein
MEKYFTPESLLSLLLLFQSIESSDLDLILKCCQDANSIIHRLQFCDKILLNSTIS